MHAGVEGAGAEENGRRTRELACGTRRLRKDGTMEPTGKTTIVRRRRPLRLVVDLNRCQGYAQCVFLAPEVFRLSGEEALRYDPNPDEALRLRVMRAAAACPVQAILVDHGDEGEAGGAS